MQVNIFKIYLDTSVISAYFEFNKPLRQLISHETLGILLISKP